jgi:SEC-C motif domain protein
MKALAASAPCPCGRVGGQGKSSKPLAYAALPPDAEALMRSRYSAFALERAAYLLQSWAASHRPASIEFDPGVKWLGLEIRLHRRTDEASAEVEFVARQKPLTGPAVRLHERSRFVCEDDRWLYVDGDAL